MSSRKKGYVLARYQGLEVPCQPDTVTRYRAGKISLADCVVVEEVFTNFAKGQRATEQQLGVLGVTSMHGAVEAILKRGDYQMTTAERAEQQAQHRRAIIHHICQHYVEPKTGRALPATRVELALDQIKVKIDFSIHMDKQIDMVRKALVGILALKAK